MPDETLLLVDDDNVLLGYASREACHTGVGLRHRAFITVVFDSQDNVLLQRRRHRLFDGLWDLTAASHLLHLPEGDEDYQMASDRALRREMQIQHVAIRSLGAFIYTASSGDNLCENEHCSVLAGRWDGPSIPNPEDVYEAKNVAYAELVRDIEEQPRTYAPWAVLAVHVLQRRKGPIGDSIGG
jgi:isopentenyl-diphosphate Delta-isomerase